ncbi:MAG TPA: hypothetical protein VN690_05855 [Terriglobales bacterium]|nr:hypothetical protein [Terriglobales bacterium]
MCNWSRFGIHFGLGLALILVGTALLFKNLGLSYLQWWPIWFIVAGLWMVAARRWPKEDRRG